METAARVDEGFIPFRGHRVWHKVVGEGEDPGKLPPLCLHGGPGMGHDYLEPLSRMVDTGRRVIFYDQLGCGRSDHPHDPSVTTVDLFVEEIGVVREALGLDQIHLFGNSWGGMLAMEYALTEPEGVESLVLESSPASMEQWVEEANRLRRDLPLDVQETLRRHEEAGTTDDPAYEEMMLVFYRRHFCRLDPWPDYVKRPLDKVEEDPEVYHTMNGPSEFHVVGTLHDRDITDRLGEIKVPTLVTSGRHD